MILETLLLGGALGSGYAVFIRQDKVFETRVLREQRRRTRVLRARLVSKQASRGATQPFSTAAVSEVSGDHDVAVNSAMRRSPLDMVLLGGALATATTGALVFPPIAYAAPPLMLFAARKRFFTAGRQLCKGQVGVELISSMSITGAILAEYFVIGSLLSLISGVGDRLSSRVIRESKTDLTSMLEGMPETVWVLKDGVEISIPLDQAQAGAILAICAGETIPADGSIVWGAAGIDEQRFTGEALPVEKAEGDDVFAMTLVLSGKIHVRIERAGADTSAARIADVLTHTADYKSSTLLESQELSQKLVAPTLVASACVFPAFGYSAAVGMLFAHPKDRLQTSAPISLITYLRQAMQEGLLIKDGRSLELLNKVDTIVFDKTGTLTDETPCVGDIHCLHDGYVETDVLMYAAVAEHRQIHPLARAIRNAAELRGLKYCAPEHSEFRLGFGVRAYLDGKVITIGSARLIVAEGMTLSRETNAVLKRCENEDHGVILIAVDGCLIGAIELLPNVRAEARATIASLKALPNIELTCIISGDRVQPTRTLAEDLGIDACFAQVLPEQKAAIIDELQQEGRFVCYIGDGINDAIAMKQAQVSISVQGAAQIATDTAQIVLLDQGVGNLPRLFDLSRGFKRHMDRQFKLILAPSVLGAGMIVLSGWGMVYVMVMNMAALAATIGTAVLERPPTARKSGRKSDTVTPQAQPAAGADDCADRDPGDLMNSEAAVRCLRTGKPETVEPD